MPGPSGVSTRSIVLPSRASLIGADMWRIFSPACSTTWSPSSSSPAPRLIWVSLLSWSVTGSRRKTVPSGRSTSAKSSFASSVTEIMPLLSHRYASADKSGVQYSFQTTSFDPDVNENLNPKFGFRWTASLCSRKNPPANSHPGGIQSYGPERRTHGIRNKAGR